MTVVDLEARRVAGWIDVIEYRLENFKNTTQLERALGNLVLRQQKQIAELEALVRPAKPVADESLVEYHGGDPRAVYP